MEIENRNENKKLKQSSYHNFPYLTGSTLIIGYDTQSGCQFKQLPHFLIFPIDLDIEEVWSAVKNYVHAHVQGSIYAPWNKACFQYNYDSPRALNPSISN